MLKRCALVRAFVVTGQFEAIFVYGQPHIEAHIGYMEH
jgi:hypothetical protein